MSYEIIKADVRKWSEEYDGELYHAIFCDPPYHLHRDSLGGPSGKWDHSHGNHDAGGFMGKKWDGGDIAFDPETWAALATHLLPGAFGMAFASSRGWHRLACAIEDAGLTIHPSIFGWSFGSGFPKATRVKDAPDFDGHRYGLQALKPALEPIIVFQKPYAGKPAACIAQTGAGALWIDGGRIAGAYKCDGGTPGFTAGKGWNPNSMVRLGERETTGRWPANFFLVHDPRCEHIGTKRVSGGTGGEHSGRNGTRDVVGEYGYGRVEITRYADADGMETVAEWHCVPECPVRLLGEQSGVLRNGGQNETSGERTGIFGVRKPQIGGTKYAGDQGTASRFFFNGDWSYEIAERLDNADLAFYCAKVSRKERDAGLDDMPLQHSKSTGMSGDSMPERRDTRPGRTQQERPEPMSRNVHPTVKPIALNKWLATLLLPPTAYSPRRLLVPFAGSGSEMIGALLSGWEHVTGVEIGQEYVDVANARLKYWVSKPQQLTLEDAE